MLEFQKRFQDVKISDRFLENLSKKFIHFSKIWEESMPKIQI